VGSCVGEAWPTANPTSPGPFQWTADKNVGPLAGYTPDPTYGDQQQRFNVYRPENLAESGYCHPILVWSNGHTDNPEQNPPDCVVNASTNQWCGTYPPLIEHLASQGFVVIASLSTTTSREDPATSKLPSIVGLDWLLEQAEDPSSRYYHHLDTTRIGALGHSEGGMATCMLASDPRLSAIATVSGTRELTGLHTPALLICGGQDTVVSCDSVASTYNGVTDQPAMLMNNLTADHGGWLYQNGAQGPSIFALAAWFRFYLMDDTANGEYFFGANCTLCTDNRVTVERNSLMTQ
jgi:predicted dienelactone hydrolase